jgi:cellulose synthase/poly-beta-1,6-N-acetylglucosamine synthase-like glycosyltransferase
VLVCVDGSTDGTLAYLDQAKFPYRLVKLTHPDDRNHGRPATRNLALPHIRAELVLLLDSDMRVAEGTIVEHVELLTRTDVVSIGAVVYAQEGSSLWARYQSTRGRGRARPGAVVRPLDFTSANTAMKAEHLLATGGFDELLTSYGGEDTELGIRLAEERGLSFVYNAAAVANTAETKSVEVGLRQLEEFAATNLHRIRARHPTGPAPFWSDRIERPSLSDRIVFAALNPVSDAIVSALLPISPFALQRRLLDYKVMRAVVRGYRRGRALGDPV